MSCSSSTFINKRWLFAKMKTVKVRNITLWLPRGHFLIRCYRLNYSQDMLWNIHTCTPRINSTMLNERSVAVSTNAVVHYFSRDSSELWGYSARVLHAWKDDGNTWYSSQVSPCWAKLILGNIKLDFSFLLSLTDCTLIAFPVEKQGPF